MGTTDVGLIRYLESKKITFLPITFPAGETEAEGQFILELKEEVSNNDVEAIVLKYPPLLAFFGHVHQHESNISLALLDVIYTGLKKFKREIAEVNGDLTKLSEEKIETWGISLATLFVLVYKTFDTYGCLVLAGDLEAEENRPTSARSKKGHQPGKSRSYAFWYERETKIFEILGDVTSRPLKDILWKDAEANFFGFIVSACSALMRHTPDTVLHNDSYVEKVGRVIGNLWNVHKMETEIIKLFIMAIDKSEDAMKLTVRLAKELATKFDVPHISLRILEKACGGTVSAKFASTEKMLSAFIIEMASYCPERLSASFPILRRLLFSDSSVLRSAVITSIGILLEWSKSRETVTLREHLLNLLLHHLKDQNINVRAKAIQVLTRMVEDSSLYLVEQAKALPLVAQRINDKAVSVRKAAISYFRVVGAANPLASKFTVSGLIDLLRKYMESYFTSMVDLADGDDVILRCVAHEFADELKCNDVDFQSLKLPHEIDSGEKALKYIEDQLRERNYWKACLGLHFSMITYADCEQLPKFTGNPTQYWVFFKQLLHVEEEDGEEPAFDLGTLGKSERGLGDLERVTHYRQIKRLKMGFDASIPSFIRILEIGSPNDRKDTINLFATFCEDGYTPSPELANSIMNAIGKVDEKLVGDLIEPFFKIFVPGLEFRSTDLAVKLVNLVSTMNHENKEKMIPMFQEMFKKRPMKECISDLWTIYNDGSDEERAKSAVYLLGVKGSLHQDYVNKWLEPLMVVGLGERGYKDYTLATATFWALLNMYERCICNEPDGLYEHHLLFEKLEGLIEDGLKADNLNNSDQSFCDLVDVAIRLVYYICNDPPAITNIIVRSINLCVFPEDFKNNPVVMEGKLLRYVTLCESILEYHIYFYDIFVKDEIKRRKALAEQKNLEKKTMGPPMNHSKQTKKSGKNKSNREMNGTLENDENADDTNQSSINGGLPPAESMASRRRSMILNHRKQRLASSCANNTESNGNDEMDDMVGASDREIESVNTYIDSLLEQGVMSQVRLHVMHLCRYMDKLTYPTRVASISLLTKVMCINGRAMMATKDFFLEMWTKMACPFLKIEMIKCAMYINMRFPNCMESINKAILKGLKEEDVKLRIATLDFIIYLCMSDVIKVREYLVGSSVCLNDQNPAIRDAAQDFYFKMSEKNNRVFNSIPEIISYLSKENPLPLLEFQNIMRFLLVKLKKPIQIAGLIEKLVARFKTLDTERQRQDVAFSLSLLSYNDKTFRIIEDGFRNYCDGLEDPLLFDCFMQIVSSAKKSCTKEFKVTIESFEQNLLKWKDTCDNRDGQTHNAVMQSASKQVSATPSKRNPVRKSRTVKRISTSESEEEGSENSSSNSVDNDKEIIPAVKNPASVDESENSSSNSVADEDMPVAKNPANVDSNSSNSVDDEDMPVAKNPASVDESENSSSNSVDDEDMPVAKIPASAEESEESE